MALPKALKVGSRGSALALAQTNSIVTELQQKNPQLTIEIVTIQTSGDRFRGKRLAEAGGKGLFVKEIEEALLEGQIDFAIHSLKDMPGSLPGNLQLACFPKRADPRDCFVSLKYKRFEDLPADAVIGTASPRRTVQILAKRPDLKAEPIRGNVETRLKKLNDGNYDAIILAAAGLERLGKTEVVTEYFEPGFLLPAVGQGILAIEVRQSGQTLADFLKKNLNHEPTETAALAERAFLQTIGGDCFTPLGGLAQIQNRNLYLQGWLATPDGKRQARLGQSGSVEKPEELGEALAKEILNAIADHKAP